MLLTIDFSVIVTLTTVVTAAALQLWIKPTGDRFVKPEGDAILFTCEASSASEGIVQWRDTQHRRISEDNTKRIYVEQTDSMSKLYITSIRQEDAGQYVCSAGSQTKSVELIYFKDITFDNAPSPQHPKINVTALIQCQVSGSPAPEISWRYRGRPLKTGGRYTTLRDGLQIRDITLADDGNYTCRAEVESNGRYNEKTIVVAVHIPPRVVKGPDTITEVEGTQVNMTCRASGLPQPKFEFIKGLSARGEVMSSKDHIHIDADAGRITFRPVKREDDGFYMCRAVNDVGSDFKTGRLNVYVRPNITELRNITRYENETGTLVCLASGYPEPEMYFQKEGNRNPYETGYYEGSRIYISKKSFGYLEMTIRNLSPSDATNYTCSAKNSVGQANKTGFIDVQFKPRIGEDNNRAAFGWAGTRHNISCKVLAQPPPDIRWIRHNRQLADNETFQIFYTGKQSNLQVRIKETDQSWIYGEYICIANNSLGTAFGRFTLNRATVPDRPFRVNNVEITPNQVVLRVEPPRENGGINITGYRVEFENKIQDVSVAEPFDMLRPFRNWFGNFSTNRYPSTDLSIDNLRPGTRYIFRICAKNDVGVGSSLEHLITTANLTKPYPIKITSPSRGIYTDEYRVTWATPKTGGQPIKSYQFRYRKLRSPSEKYSTKAENWIVDNEDDNPNRPVREYKLNGLESNTEYELQVIARNELGSSLPHEQFIFRTSNVNPYSVRSSCPATSISGHILSWVHLAALLPLLIKKIAAE